MTVTPVPLAFTVAVELGGTVRLVPLVVVTMAGALDVLIVEPLTTGHVGTAEGVVTPLIAMGCLLVTVATRDCAHDSVTATASSTKGLSFRTICLPPLAIF